MQAELLAIGIGAAVLVPVIVPVLRQSARRRCGRCCAARKVGLILDGEIVMTDDEGRPQFTALMFGRRPLSSSSSTCYSSKGETCASCRFGGARLPLDA